MIEVMVLAWIAFMIMVICIPFAMIKRGTYITGRDLFFTFLGMVVMSGFALIALFT